MGSFDFTPLLPTDLDNALFESLRDTITDVIGDKELASTLAFPCVDAVWEVVAAYPFTPGRNGHAIRRLRVVPPHDPEVNS